MANAKDVKNSKDSFEVPDSIRNFLVVEDCANFPIERYVLTPSESQIAKDIVKMRKVVPRLREMNIDYLNATLLYGAPGTGKAQPLSSKVLTPIGYRSMGSLEIGDEVITPDGGRAKVMAIYPQGMKDVYKVTLKDGATCRCSMDHLWEVTTPDDRLRSRNTGKRYSKVMTLSDMIKILKESGDRTNYFAIPAPVPYDGDVTEYDVSPEEFGKMMAEGLANEDETYLAGTIEQRKALLEAFKKNSSSRSRVFEKNPAVRIRDGDTTETVDIYAGGVGRLIRDIAWSVGIGCEYRDDRDDVMFFTNENTERIIEKIEPDGKEECQCIYINDPRHLYITDGMIATHNTTFGRYMAYKMNLRFAFMQFANILSGGMGDTSKNITAVFEFIKDKNCIFMMDEIDAISAKRGFGEAASGGELGRITITVMQELDKLKKQGCGTIIIAATNISTNNMDEALVSRFPIVREVRTWTNSEKVAYIHKFLSSTGLPEDDDEITAYVSSHSSLNQRGIEADLIRAAAEWIAGGMTEFKIEHIKEKV